MSDEKKGRAPVRIEQFENGRWEDPTAVGDGREAQVFPTIHAAREYIRTEVGDEGRILPGLPVRLIRVEQEFTPMLKTTVQMSVQL